MSLVGAVILFKFFKSSAIVTGKKYQAGGAIAGFIIIYGILYGSFYNIEKTGYQKLIKEHRQYSEILNAKHITGTINPYKENIKIILAVKETDPDRSGTFKLKASCLDPENDDVRLYVMLGDKYVHYNIYSNEEMNGIDIPIDFR